MPDYLVEVYTSADPDPAALARLSEGSAVRYLRSILIPGDEISLHLVEAESAERVAEAFEQAGLAANRVVEAVDMQAPTTVGEQRKEGNVMRRTLVIVSTLVVLALTAFAGGAAAAPSETPIGFVGACNMLAAWPGFGPAQGVGVQPGGGMEHAMNVDNPNGNAGMFNAVFVSNGDC